MTTEYVPYDGDYIEGVDYTKFINDIQTEAGIDIGIYREICVTLTLDGKDKIQVDCSNDEGDEWEWTDTFPVPSGWDMALVKEMFVGLVYMRTDAYQELEKLVTKLVDWNCPECGETNTDKPNRETHCAKCGRVVFVLDEDDSFHDLHYKVDL